MSHRICILDIGILFAYLYDDSLRCVAINPVSHDLE